MVRAVRSSPSTPRIWQTFTRRSRIAVIVAGATDVGLWVTKQMRQLSPVIFINHLTELQTIDETADKVRLWRRRDLYPGQNVLAKNFPRSASAIRIGGQQVRNMGNDRRQCRQRLADRRHAPRSHRARCDGDLALAQRRAQSAAVDYFIEYGKQAREAGEFVEALEIPKLGTDEFYAIYKISKRRDEDIPRSAAPSG